MREQKRDERLVRLWMWLSVPALALVALTTCAGQQAGGIGDRIETLKLPSLPGPVSASYSRGQEARATFIRDMANGMVAFYQEKLGVARDVRVLVLDPADWRRLLGNSMYGVPRFEQPNFVIVPATLPPAYVEVERLIVAGLPTLSPAVAAELRSIGFRSPSVKDLAQLGQDAILYHELGHLYTRALGIATPRDWLDELLANYWWWGYTHEAYPALAALEPRLDTLYPPLPAPRYTSLEDFERLYPDIAFENYMWYQRRFGGRAKEVYARRGLQFLVDLRDALPRERPEALTDAQLIERLERLSPGWGEWVATFGPR